MSISGQLALPHRMEFPPEQDPLRAVTAVVRTLKQHPEGIEAQIGGAVTLFRSSTMVVDILKFFRDTAKPSAAPSAPVRELVVEANPAGVEIAEAPVRERVVEANPAGIEMVEAPAKVSKPARKRDTTKRKKK